MKRDAAVVRRHWRQEQRWSQALWDAAGNIDLRRELRLLARAKQPREMTEIELWPEEGEKRSEFMERCIDELTPCIGDKAPGVCADKWRASGKLGKKGFVARADLSGDLALAPCGKTCLACEGAPAPFDARAWNEADHPRVPAGSPDGGQFGEGGGGKEGGGKGGKGKAGGKKGKVKLEEFTKDKVAVDAAKPEKFIEAWNDAIGLDPGEFHQKFTGGLKSTMEISHRYYEHADGDVMENEIRINGKLLDENDRAIGTYTREIDLKNNKAESSYFALNSSAQGKGEGKQMLAANVALYQELGLDEVKVHANIDVGGYAWAKYGYVPTEDSWNDLRETLREKLNASEGGGGYTPEEWDAMSSDNQDSVEQHWKENARDDVAQSEEENWRESGQALEAAKIDTAGKFAGANGDVQWANNAVDKWRSERDADAPPAPSNKEILENVTIGYDPRHGDGREDPDITIDEGALKDLPEHDLNTLESALIESFNGRAEDKANEMDPPDDLVDDALDSIWNDMRNRDKFSYAEDNGLIEDVEGESGDFEGPAVDVSEEEKSDLGDLLDSDDPKAIWAIADAPGGKELLLGSDWYGAIKFDDPDSIARFEAYVGKVKQSAKAAA